MDLMPPQTAGPKGRDRRSRTSWSSWRVMMLFPWCFCADDCTALKEQIKENTKKYPRVYVAASAFNFMYRSPIPIVSYLNLAKAFSTDIWAILPLSVLVFAFLFWLIYQWENCDEVTYEGHINSIPIHRAYQQEGMTYLTKKSVRSFDFVLMSFSTLFEPHAINWFPKFSTGTCKFWKWQNSSFMYTKSMIKIAIYHSNFTVNHWTFSCIP